MNAISYPVQTSESLCPHCGFAGGVHPAHCPEFIAAMATGVPRAASQWTCGDIGWLSEVQSGADHPVPLRRRRKIHAPAAAVKDDRDEKGLSGERRR